MIPLKLQIKNFVSYGPNPQIINFEPYHLICLSGKNGHGKSALLDAITWAIWGQARKQGATAKADEGLLRLGQTNMMVSLDFLCNNAKYRIRREYTVNGNKATSNLDFAIQDNNNFKSLTDKTIKLTQEKIENMIGLSYDSFINSAFLRQGQSNEFSKKTAKERKEILANILGLDKFEKIRKIALEKGRIANLEKDGLKRFLEQIKKEFDLKESFILQFEDTKKRLELIFQEDLLNIKKIEEINKQEEEIINIKNKNSQFSFQKVQYQNTLNQKLETINNIVNKWRQILKEKRKKIDFNKIEQELKNQEIELKKVIENKTNKINFKEKYLLKKEEENNYLKKINLDFNQKIENNKLEFQKVSLNIINSEEKIKEQENVINKKNEEINKYKVELITLNQDNLKIEKKTKELILEEKIFEKRKKCLQKFTTQLDLLEEKIKNNLEKKKNINLENANCPLCKQEINTKYKENLNNLFNKENIFFTHQTNRLKNIIENLKIILEKQFKNISNLKINLEKEKIKEIQIQEIQKNIVKENNEVEKLNLILKELKAKIENDNKSKLKLEEDFEKLTLEYNQLLNIDTHYQNLVSQIKFLELEIEKIIYDSEQENLINLKIKTLEQEKNNYSELIKEINLQDERKENISKLCKEAKELKKQINLTVKEINQNNIFLNQEKEIFIKKAELLSQQKYLVSNKEELILKKGGLEQQLKTVEIKEAEYTKQQEELKKLEKTGQEYNIIAAALSKDGIQALLIEDAIPEIEHEANSLLSKLTDNQAQLYIESLRDLRSGGTKETLDIKISDPLGIRPYELFSGGEAFRIDFALRIAISKLLARRAGTSLQTLIIDEGFGSQDEEGLANIMDSLHKIQEDFAKVIIVSHLPSMKDQFPTNFFIHKGPSGSQIKVIEQG